jgi:hypothetical protein
MTKLGRIEHRILAVDPTHRGFGYVVFEGPDFLVDWGVRNVRGPKNSCCVQAISHLIEHYTPDVLVLEDGDARDSRRRERVRKLIDELIELAAANGVRVHRVSRTKVGQVFARLGATNKHRVASVIAVRFPELAPRLPPERKPWMSEDRRMAIFDAAAFALASYGKTRSSSDPVAAGL